MPDHQKPERLILESRLEEIKRAEKNLLAQAAQHGFNESDRFALKLSLEEALTNAIKHGNRYDADKTVQVSFLFDDDSVTITVRDQGQGFNPDQIPDCRLDENLEKISGRGIMLIHAYMSDVKFSNGGRCVTMVKKR